MRTPILLIAIAACAALAHADPKPKPTPAALVGRWRVVGCDTSPGDPDDCARGTITFTPGRYTIDLPCCKRARAFTVVSTAPGAIEIHEATDNRTSKITIDAKGTARWLPPLDNGRVGELMFVRATTP